MASARDTPLVSIVIVAHDNWPELELAIESSLNQSYTPIEVILIDNESSDATAFEVAKRYGGRLTYVRQKNSFDSGGYNRGITEAKGDFVQFLDGDDFLAPHKIAKQMACFDARTELDIVYSDIRQFQADAGKSAWEDRDSREHQDFLAALVARDDQRPGLLIHSVLVRRAALERVGSWDEDIVGADHDYWLRAAALGCHFGYCPGSLCFYRRGRTQMTADPTAMMERMERTLYKALGYITTEPYVGRIRSRLAALLFTGALLRSDIGRSQAIARLEAARAMDPAGISLLLRLAGTTVVAIPGLRSLLRHPASARARRLGARALGLTVDG